MNEQVSMRLLNVVYSQPWSITGEGWMSVHQALQNHLSRKMLPEEERRGDAGFWKRAFGDFIVQRPDMDIDKNGIAHIHVFGVLGPKLSNIEKACGTTDYGDLQSELTEARKNADGILLHVDSPGGYTRGNIEISKFLADVAATMPVVAHTDGYMASAAYAISVGANVLFANRSADVGSIGVILPLIDRSGEWKMKGIAPAYITHTGGDLKDAGYPPSFSAEHIEYFQEIVDDSFAAFRDHVLAHRQIDDSSMRGQCFTGGRAKENNFVDAIGTEADAYRYLQSMLDG